ncbi:L,D-transpeptidase family protein [Halomonas sp. V046]|uniref:L,D-transpeptidase family protein n=1 Tax=Halomonas sp. V046 TaxID=3459611 RepID=UPI0040443F57
MIDTRFVSGTMRRCVMLAALGACLSAGPSMAAPNVEVGAGQDAASTAVAPGTAARVVTDAANVSTGEVSVERQLDGGKDLAQAPLGAELLDSSDRITRFYALRGQRPVWTDAARVDALVAALEALDADGLNPRDYRPEAIAASARVALGEGASGEARDRFERDTTGTLFTALTHLQRGKVDPQRIDSDWEVPIDPASFDLVAMSQALDDGDVNAAMDLARPPFEPYQQLRAGLARYRNIERLGGWPQLPAREEALRPGDVDADVALLRQRLAMIGELEVMAADVDHYPSIDLKAPHAEAYDEALEAAVKRFQRSHLLTDDGVIGPNTRSALNMTVAQRIDQIRANMERARWLLHGLPESFVLVDIAGYRVIYFRPGGDVWRSRIVVGQPYRRTPTLRSEITHLTLNPTWTVPPTIYREDILPKVRNNPGYLASRGLYPLSSSGQRLDPASVNWSNPRGVMLRQGAGPSNPLGRVVIRFPNDHLVYLHDTPSRGLFNRAQRALSSGCIRVEGVAELAQLLFDDSGTNASVSRLIAAGDTRNVSLKQRIPVVLNYWTVQPESGGELAFRPDIYNRDSDLVAALNAPAVLQSGAPAAP